MIGVSVDAEGPSDLGNKLTDGARAGLKQAVEEGFRVSQEKAPVDTGELKQSGEIVDTGDVITFRYTADHALLVESGTEPHPIEPVDAEKLVFEIDGETIVTDHVDHPGTEPQPYVQPGFREMARQLRGRGLSPHIDGELGGPI